MSKRSRRRVIEIEARPKTLDERNRSLIQILKDFLIPRLRQQETFAVAYEEAKIRIAVAESERLVQEAAKLAAERELAEQAKLKEYCDAVDKIFNLSDPAEVRALKMAGFIQANPHVAQQLTKVSQLVAALEAAKGLRIAAQVSASPIGATQKK